MSDVCDQALRHDERHYCPRLSLHFATDPSACLMMHDASTSSTGNIPSPHRTARSRRAPLTVIVPTYNRSCFLQESLDSLIAQEWRPESILCVDDGSTDDTRSVVERYGHEVRYIAKPNGGKSSAINLVLPIVESEFVWFFDDDDIAYPWAVSTLVPLLQDNSALGFVFGAKDYGVSGADGRLQFSRPATVSTALAGGLATQRVSLFRESTFLLNGTIIRTKLAQAVGKFREDLPRSQDYEFLVRLAAQTTFAHVERSIYLMRVHDGDRGPASNRFRARDRQRIWRRFDAAIGSYIKKELDLEIFARELPDLVATRPELRYVPTERFARITRAWVLATKSEIVTMSEDLLDALQTDGPRLCEIEKTRLADLMNHHYLVDSISESIKPLLRLVNLRKSANGRIALHLFAKALYWQSRTTPAARKKFDAIFLSIIFLTSALATRKTTDQKRV